MSNHALSLPTASMPRTAVLLGLSQLVLTAVHHAYGAYIYDTPWRYQVAGFAAVVALVIAGLSFAAHRYQAERIGRPLLWLNMATILVVPVLVIGVVEGGYNHFVKDIVYFAGDTALFLRMFPAPAYEPPSDWFFEVTGVAQFALGLWAGLRAIKALQSRTAGAIPDPGDPISEAEDIKRSSIERPKRKVCGRISCGGFLLNPTRCRTSRQDRGSAPR